MEFSMRCLQQKIERLIFLQNYTNPLLSKEAALMCVHAVLTHRENVPRIYLLDNIENDNQNLVWSSISSCLLSDEKVIFNWTMASLKLLHISSNELSHISYDERQNCILMIEENLESCLGSGYLYYEMSRFTPFTDDDISKLLSNIESPTETWQSILYRRLRERMFAKIQYHQKHAHVLLKLNLTGEWDMFHTVYKFKLEQAWQQSWLNSKQYQMDANIIDTIVVGDTFEY
jgi:hypothetical protein